MAVDWKGSRLYFGHASEYLEYEISVANETMTHKMVVSLNNRDAKETSSGS